MRAQLLLAQSGRRRSPLMRSKVRHELQIVLHPAALSRPILFDSTHCSSTTVTSLRTQSLFINLTHSSSTTSTFLLGRGNSSPATSTSLRPHPPSQSLVLVSQSVLLRPRPVVLSRTHSLFEHIRFSPITPRLPVRQHPTLLRRIPISNENEPIPLRQQPVFD